MPCQGGMSYERIVVESREIIDDLTQKLCYLCASLYMHGLLDKYGNEEIVAWHQDHMHKDEVRVGREMTDLFVNDPSLMGDTDRVAEKFVAKAEAAHPVSEFHKEWFKRMAREAAMNVRHAMEMQATEVGVKASAMAKLTPAERKALGL